MVIYLILSMPYLFTRSGQQLPMNCFPPFYVNEQYLISLGLVGQFVQISLLLPLDKLGIPYFHYLYTQFGFIIVLSFLDL